MTTERALWPLVRKQTIPTERPPFVGEVSANFCREREFVWSAQRAPTAVNLDLLNGSHKDEAF
jgi:hypothetical protein